MRKLIGLVMVFGLAASLLFVIPGAPAAPVSQGQVLGTVTVNPTAVGVPCTIDPNSPPYQFSGVFINGAFTDNNNQPWGGSIGVENTHGKARQCFDASHVTSMWGSSVIFNGDMGTVNCPPAWYTAADNLCPTGSQASITASNPFDPAHFIATNGVNRIIGLYYGTYLRDGPHTKVQLHVFTRIEPANATDNWDACATTVSGKLVGPNTSYCPEGTVYVLAEFAPEITNANLEYNQAAFTGSFGTTKPW